MPGPEKESNTKNKGFLNCIFCNKTTSILKKKLKKGEIEIIFDIGE